MLLSSSRARTRAAALVAAVPVLVATGPFVSPALAAGGYTVALAAQPGQVFGPSAGYLGNGIGQNGTTEVFRISVPSAQSTITSVRVALTSDSTQIALGRDFDNGDGFALYANTDGSAGFSEADKQTGLRSTGWINERTDASGQTPIQILLPNAVSGATEYFVTVHPAKVNFPNRTFALKMLSGAVTGGSDDGPAAEVATPTAAGQRYVIDSQAPGAPPKSAFTAHPQQAGTEDFYAVGRSAATESGAKIAFYNNGSDPAPAHVLVHPNGTPVIDIAASPDVTVTSRNVLIGDGSGITATKPVANNRQTNNTTFVRTLDAVGNFSSATGLLMAYPSSESDRTARGNPVVAPAQPTSSAISDAGANVPGINANNQGAVPVRVSNPTKAESTNDTVSVATGSIVRLVQLAADGKPDLTKTGQPKSIAYGSPTADTTADSRPVTGPPAFAGIAEGAMAVAQAASVDAYGNVSDYVTSGSKRKDTIAPVLAVVDAIRTGQAVPGDVVRLQFTEAMDTSKISNSAPNPNPEGSGCAEPTALERPSSVHGRLPVTTAGGDARSWGYGACFQWGADGTSATVTVGAAHGAANGCVTGCTPLFSTTDVVKPAGTVAAPVVTDLVGNQLRGFSGDASNVGATTIGSATAYPLLGGTNDGNADGYIDSADVTFSTGVDISDSEAFLANLKAVGPTTLPIQAVSYPTVNDFTKVRFHFADGVFTTDVRPTITLSRPTGPNTTTGLTTKEAQAREVLPFGFMVSDRAAPRPLAATYVDNDKDGQIDEVQVRYSEPIDHARDNNNNTEAGGNNGYDVPGYENTPSVNTNHNTVSPTTGATNTKLVALKEKTAPDTGIPGIVLYYTDQTSQTPSITCLQPPCTVMDTITPPNLGGDYSISVVDGAYPVILSRTTRDLDFDGAIDAIDVKFSEALSTPSLGLAQFSVANHQLLDQFGLPGGDSIRLVINETPLRGKGDTADKPAVTYLGGVSDTQGNATPKDSAGVASSDGAGPAIVAACPMTPAPNNGICPAGTDGTKMLVVFSEPVAAASVAQADFVVEQPLGTVKAQNAAPTVASEKVTLSFAAGATALDATKDAFVKLSAIDVVDDTATPTANKSKQVSYVTAYAPPTATMNLTCPIAASPGYCGASYVNTNAAGSGGVSLWRLATTARSATPADSEFSATHPAIYPPAGSPALPEGALTLYLTGKDDYGRLTPEVTRSITILKAPAITGARLVNNSTRATNTWSRNDTVRDGDTVAASATAYSSDIANWTGTNGACLAQHMSVDYSKATANTAHSALAPVACTLNTATAPDSRKMEFPFVKVSGTTHFPVGTVIKLTANDPGALIVDGLNGTQLRRHFISVNARRSHQIPDALVITVPPSVMTGIKKGSGIGYRDGSIIKTTTSGYYYLYQNVKRPVTTATLAAWKIPTNRAYIVSAAEFNAHGTGVGLRPGAHALGTWVKFSNGSISQIVRNQQGVVVRRGVASALALPTLVPSTQIYPANSQDAAIPFDTTFLRGYRDGTLVKLGTNSYAVVARTTLRKFANMQTLYGMGFNPANAVTFSSSRMPRPYTGAYLTGTDIDRYKLDTIVVKVTNKAGASTTAVVRSYTGTQLYGIGNLDPVPANWDTTRS